MSKPNPYFYRWKTGTIESIWRTALWSSDKALAVALYEQLEVARDEDFSDLETMIEKVAEYLPKDYVRETL